MSKRLIKEEEQQQESRDDSQIQSPKAHESKFETIQPTNIEFQLPGLLDLSILTPNHFKAIGDYGIEAGEFDCPVSITQQRTTGRYFISEWNNNRIQVLDENFTHYMFVGERGNELGQLNGPRGVAVSEEGRLVVCETYSKRIQIFDVNSSHDQVRFISMVNFDSYPYCVVMEEGTGRLFFFS